MIITCDNCNTRYDLDDSLISGKPFIKVRCSMCDNRFKVHGKAETDVQLLPENIVKADWDKTIAISNQKGGVAKTSTCMNLGVSLAMMGKKVLLVDFDVQANLTISLGYPTHSASFFDILKSGTEDITEYIQATRYNNLYLLPSNSKMALLTKQYMHKPDYEFLLRDRLASVSGQYDYIIIDTPPALGFCTLNALMASHYIIIPTPCEYLSLHGIHMIEDVIKIVQVRSGRKINYRVLITMHDPQSTAARVIFKKITNIFQNKVLQTVIDLDQRMKESQIVHLPVYHYAKQSSSARQYQQLAREVAILTA
ncbi:MAG: zinc-ribbon domain-containing protein [Desulfobulbaceae bacterium]|nr:zinc-ribbon domain-containing protein [Desulfobulbaceae bacterium]